MLHPRNTVLPESWGDACNSICLTGWVTHDPLIFCDHLFQTCPLCSACSIYAVEVYRYLGEMCVVLFDEPYGSRMTHLPVCERQPRWEGRERIRDAYSLPSQRFSLALSFPQPTPLLWRTDELNRSHDFMKKISFLCVLCSIMGMCSFTSPSIGGWGRRKAGDWGRKPGRGRGIAAGLPPFPRVVSPRQR